MTQEVFNEFDDPGSSVGVDWTELRGRLLLIYPKEQVTQTTKDYGDKDAVKADVTVLDGEGAPSEYRNTLVFPLVLQGQLRNTVGTGRPVVGRLTGGSKAEKATREEKAWKLDVATDEDKQKARDYINRKPVVSDPTEAPF